MESHMMVQKAPMPVLEEVLATNDEMTAASDSGLPS
jgi:hypothetical protein